MEFRMRERVLTALRAAIAAIEAGRDSDLSFVTVYAEDVEFHEDAEGAQDDAQEELDRRRDSAADDTGWHPGCGNIGWGVYVPIQVVDIIDKGPDPRRPQFDMILDVKLREWDGKDGEYIPFDGKDGESFDGGAQ